MSGKDKSCQNILIPKYFIKRFMHKNISKFQMAHFFQGKNHHSKIQLHTNLHAISFFCSGILNPV